MRIEETEGGRRWLQQFQVVDREVARQLLRRLTLVSHSQFETNLQKTIGSVLERIGPENCGLFAVTELRPAAASGKARRVPGSSADRVAHILENVSRVRGARVSFNPTVDAMRAERVKNIVLVDDFIGSGDRISSYWHNLVPRSVKSWLSYKWTKLWVVVYAGLASGLNATRRTLPVSKERLLTVIPERDPRLGLTEAMRDLAYKYGAALRKSAWYGYSGGGGTVIFQHGCPNNTPAILWAQRTRFKPIFPNRGIPPELSDCFSGSDAYATAEVLWTFKQYRLALALLDDLRRQNASGDEWQLAIALGLAASYGKWSDVKLQSQLGLPHDDIGRLRRFSYSLGAINIQDHRLTPFGRDLVDRFKLDKKPKRKPRSSRSLPSLQDLYYPDSCGGVAKR